jgi:hypothetical protein
MGNTSRQPKEDNKKMEKIIVVEGLGKLNPAAKALEGAQVITGLTDNTFFPDCVAQVADLTTATSKLNAAILLKDATIIAQRVSSFEAFYKNCTMYVQSKLVGIDPEIAKIMVESANLKWKKTGKYEPPLLGVKKGTADHTNDLKRIAFVNSKNKKVPAAYIWRKGEGAFVEENMKQFMVSTDCYVSDTNVTPGVITWYDVATVKGSTQGPFSPAVKG